MQIINNFKFPAFFLRLAIGASYSWEVADRLGVFGPYGTPHVGWGDWGHFVTATHQTVNFLPASFAPTLALLATIGEASFGVLLILGLFTRIAAIGSGFLSFCFALSMTLSAGIDAPLGYSVFTLCAASFLLATLQEYKWSIDSLLSAKYSR